MEEKRNKVGVPFILRLRLRTVQSPYYATASISSARVTRRNITEKLIAIQVDIMFSGLPASDHPSKYDGPNSNPTRIQSSSVNCNSLPILRLYISPGTRLSDKPRSRVSDTLRRRLAKPVNCSPPISSRVMILGFCASTYPDSEKHDAHNDIRSTTSSAIPKGAPSKEIRSGGVLIVQSQSCQNLIPSCLCRI